MKVGELKETCQTYTGSCLTNLILVYYRCGDSSIGITEPVLTSAQNCRTGLLDKGDTHTHTNTHKIQHENEMICYLKGRTQRPVCSGGSFSGCKAAEA